MNQKHTFSPKLSFPTTTARTINRELGIHILIFFLFIILSFNVFADQDIDIIGGKSAGLPKIAVVAFAGDSPEVNNAADIIAKDLSITGEFNVQEYSSIDQVESGVAYVITGIVNNNSSINYILRNKNSGNNVMLNQKVGNVANTNFRYVAHSCSNVIYQKLTNVKGIFTTKIAYIVQNGNQYQIVISDYDGYNQKAVVTAGAPLISLAWNKTGRKIAYASFESGKPVVYVQDLYAGTRTLVANFSGTNSSPAFVPNNSQLAVTLTKDYGSHIFLVNDQRYSSKSRAIPLITNFGSIDTEASIADNGNMVFTSNHDGGPQIFMSNLNGAEPVRLTLNLGNYNTTARFSHDGSKITFINRNYGVLKAYLMDLATKNSYPISLNTTADTSPSFAPNDKLILLSSDNSIYIANSTGTIETRLNKINTDNGKIIDQRWANNF